MILGLGGSVSVSMGKHVFINVELTELHCWYTQKKIYWYNDKDPDLLSMKGSSTTKLKKSDCGDCASYQGSGNEPAEGDVVWVDSENREYLCTGPVVCGTDASFKDNKDLEHEWFFPLISVRVAVTF